MPALAHTSGHICSHSASAAYRCSMYRCVCVEIMGRSVNGAAIHSASV